MDWSTKDVWKSTTAASGEQSVMISSTMLMLPLLARVLVMGQYYLLWITVCSHHGIASVQSVKSSML